MHPFFHVFGLTIPAFGSMMLCGILAAFLLLHMTRKHIAITEDDYLSAAIWAIIFGMLGSKITYWIVEFDQVLADPSFLLHTLTSGFVFYGSLIGGALGVGLFCLRKKQPLLQYIDLFAPGMVIGQAFGRIGCFLAGCCYGAPSDSPLAVCFPAGVGSAAPAGTPLLPTQLFESAFCFVLAFVLVAIFRRQKRLGAVTGWYFVLYGIWRFIIEFFRSDDRGAVGSLSTSQFLGIFIVLAGVLLLILVAKGKTPPHPIAFADDPTDGESEPADGESEPADGETEPVDGETEPADGESEPADGESEPADGESEPADGESEPVDGETEPADGETEPADGEGEPADGESEPADGESEPADTATVDADGADPDKN